jgi:hypothetical protein
VPETALYPAVKSFLEGRGYTVKGEVSGCDVVGVKHGEPTLLVIIEMKLGLSFELILQGIDRMACADEVWLAVKATRRGRDRDSRARKLCRLLGFGLLAIHPRSVETLVDPAPYRPRRDLRRRRRILAEHEARRGDPSPGGSGGIPIMTAYRQEALFCATKMRDGPCRPRDLRPDAPRAALILKRNVYGWFERVDRGLYALTPSGAEALTRWDAP